MLRGILIYPAVPTVGANLSTSDDRPRRNRRKHARRRPASSTLMVETHKGVVTTSLVADESMSGGATLYFDDDPELSVESIITVWFRQSPTKARVAHVSESQDGFRVGVQWCGEGFRRIIRPYGALRD